MAQLVFIVSRHRPTLHEYLQQEFAGNAEVAVIVDRRLGERRLRELEHSPDRRQVDRRDGLAEERLRSMGWAIVWRDESTTVYVAREEAVLLPPEGRTHPTTRPEPQCPRYPTSPASSERRSTRERFRVIAEVRSRVCRTRTRCSAIHQRSLSDVIQPR